MVIPPYGERGSHHASMMTLPLTTMNDDWLAGTPGGNYSAGYPPKHEGVAGALVNQPYQ